MGNAPGRPFYDEYAWAFDLIIEAPLGRQCDFVVEMLARRGVERGGRILDAGCGVGGHSIELARRGYMVVGLDLSAPLIEEAQKRVHGTSEMVSFSVGDILSLEGTRDHDAILCRGVLNDLLDEESRREVFFSFARSLRSGGVLILDVREWEATARRKGLEPVFEKTVESVRGRLSFQSVTRLEPQTKRLIVSERHTLRTNAAERVSIYEFMMKCWTKDELSRGLERAGFASMEFFGDYDPLMPQGGSDRIVCVATLKEVQDFT